MLDLSCPHCGFSRPVDPARVPDGAVRVTCPQCRQAFSYRKPEFDFAAAETTRPRAGFWIRAVAATIDCLIVFVTQLLLGGALGVAVTLITGGPDAWMTAVLQTGTSLFGLTLGTLYYVGLTGYCGQTLGKLALGLKVVRTDGGPVGYSRAALRETLGKFLSAFLFGVGFLMIAWSRNKEGLHDKIAGTCVVRL